MTAALRRDAIACWTAAVAAVEPEALVHARLASSPSGLALRARDGSVSASHAGPVLVVGGGKAALGMARAAAAAAGAACVGGVIVVPHGGEGSCPGGVEVLAGAHPMPDAAGEAATRRLLDRVATAGESTLVLTVLSGGASALLVAPAPGLALADKQAVTARLLDAGADVAAVNVVRRHCSRLKGGGLARAAAGAAGLWALVLSDVVGDDPATIASGPTVGDASTFADARAVLARVLAAGAVPAAVAAHLARGVAGAVPETVEPGDPVLARTRTVIVGGNRDAVAAAAHAAAARGYAPDVVPAPVTGDAAAAGVALAARLRASPRHRAVALIAGGETTVVVQPGGRGGRCQHLALAAAVALAGEPGTVLLAAGSDGVDGPTAAAGACVDGGSAARAAARGIDPRAALAATDSATALEAAGDLFAPGATGTNVADVVVALRAAC